jgi:Flp pilus assembly protein TadG
MNKRRATGQAMVEFSLAILIFLALVMGVVDFGMSIYKYNGVSEAAREIARVASVHQGAANFGVSPEITAVVNTQKNLIPGLSSPTFACTDINGATIALTNGRWCPTSAFVSVTVTAPYRATTPLVSVIGTITMKGSSSAQIHQ